MPHVHHGAWPWSSFLVTVAVLCVLLVYMYGWSRIRSRAPRAFPAWRCGSFIVGLSLIWIATVSRLASLDHQLLTAHMIQHLLLMTFGPPLIWLGEPVKSLAAAMPLARSMLVRRLGGWPAGLAFCWLFAAATLVGWHVPAAFSLGMGSDVWHAMAQASFFAAGLLFWWPIVQPWPSAWAGPQWSIVLYLFLATLPCDILSGFLVFSDRVAYSMYLSAPRAFGLSTIDDQQCAGALMWTAVTFVYLVPAAILSTRLLSPRSV